MKDLTKLTLNLARKKADRDALTNRLGAAKPHSAKRAIVLHRLIMITAEIIRQETRIIEKVKNDRACS